jgi:AcrR family transcriptional regulator
MANKETAARRKRRRNDPSATKANILEVASEEFAAHGLSGARVDAIAERTRTSKRMIYYYFGGKDGLYQAVLEKAYADIRAQESQLNLDNLPPRAALRQLVETTFEYDEAHPRFIRLVAIENINQGEYIARSPAIREMNVSAIKTLEDILERGQAQGVIRADIDPFDVHMMISALCFFRVSNRYSFGQIFGRDLSDPKLRERHKAMIADMIWRHVRAD